MPKKRAKTILYQNKGYDIHSIRNKALHIFSDSKQTENPEYHVVRWTLRN